MNPILQDKLQELENAQDYECWYLVKQPTAFDSLCYLVSFLKDYKTETIQSNLQDYISARIANLKETNESIEISNNYRALRVAAFFGLIRMTSSKYDEAIITDAYEEINSKCNGAFENTYLYEDIIQRQIEKMFISSSVDEEYQGVRQHYRLYPVMLLYKILLEIGHSTGNYSITMTEYRYLVATTKRFEDFLDTLLLIKLLRNENHVVSEFEQFRSKFDNRLIQALKQLPTLNIDRDNIALNTNFLKEVANKVFIFEENPNVFATENYLDFLGSTRSLFDLKEDVTLDREDSARRKQDIKDETNRIKGGINTLLYGVPGSGKSFTIQTNYCDDFDLMERVVFHPDYMNTDFVGQILPTVKGEGEEKEITYDFTPGPFTRILKKAINNPDKHFYLVIEEINRGNAPAIFGEIFQLLDREIDGTSSYKITNYNIASEVFGDKETPVFIPSNLSILATMNTADQNVFTLDTAFQRRWNMKMIENDVTKAKHAEIKILDTTVTWERFNTVVNDQIITSSATTLSSEDKRLGAYFVTADVLEHISFDTHKDEIAERYNINLNDNTKLDRTIKDLNSRFGDKVIKYLWDDAFKFSREDIFDSDYKSLEKVLEYFNNSAGNKKFDIFNQDIKDNLFANNNEEVEDEE